MKTTIRFAREKDLPRIDELLLQVAAVHHTGRPDLFKAGQKKYADRQLTAILANPQTPVLAAVDGDDVLQGYAFCVFQQHADDNILTDIKTLYVDDLCVDEKMRGRHIGRALYDGVLALARQSGCYNVTLNVWSCNGAAMQFYRKCGLCPQKVGMEKIL